MKADLTDPRKANALIKGFDIVYHLADIVAGVAFVFVCSKACCYYLERIIGSNGKSP